MTTNYALGVGFESSLGGNENDARCQAKMNFIVTLHKRAPT